MKKKPRQRKLLPSSAMGSTSDFESENLGSSPKGVAKNMKDYVFTGNSTITMIEPLNGYKKEIIRGMIVLSLKEEEEC